MVDTAAIERAKEHFGKLLIPQLERVERIKAEGDWLDFSEIKPIIIGTLGGDAADESILDSAYIPAGGTVFDLVYNPAETPLLKAAKEKGAKTVSGLGMLVYQAAESFRLWTGQDADTEKMLAAGREALAGAS